MTTGFAGPWVKRARTKPGAGPPKDGDGEVPEWPLWLSLGLLAVSGVGAAFVSDWFVAALSPAVAAWHLSQAFAGLVIVSVAGNAVENVVGIQLAARNRPEYVLSVIL